jgi:hypothetical protein
MSRYLEPDDHGASNLPPSNPAAPSAERLRRMLYGSLEGIDRTIKISTPSATPTPTIGETLSPCLPPKPRHGRRAELRRGW